MTKPFRTAPMKDGIRYDSRGEPSLTNPTTEAGAATKMSDQDRDPYDPQGFYGPVGSPIEPITEVRLRQQLFESCVFLDEAKADRADDLLDAIEAAAAETERERCIEVIKREMGTTGVRSQQIIIALLAPSSKPAVT